VPGFKSLHEALDTTTPGGRLVFHVFAALAQFIRELFVGGTREGGLDAARTSPALLLNRRGPRLPVRGAGNIIRAIAAGANLDEEHITAHAGRRTFATLIRGAARERALNLLPYDR
jgi:DNA invertase Pin-like site-specific DNA recombinase